MARAATFTTYINAQTDPGLEAAFNRQAQLAVASYGTITREAEKATRATAGLLAGRGTAGITANARALTSQANATRQSVTASAASERQAARTTESLRREQRQSDSLSNTHKNLARSLNTTATAFSVVDGRMSPIAGRLLSVSRAAEQLTGLQLGLAGVGATLFALGRAGNEYATLSARLRPFYKSQTDANAAMGDVVRIADRSRASLESVVEIYARLTANADQLGLSQSRVARLTEFSAKAASISGGSASARNAALVQFSQAIGSNFQAGAGQEFNSIQEGASQIAVLLSRYFKNADGSIGTTIGNLKKLSAEGKLTTEQIADAADRATPALEAMFAALPKTLGSAGTEFSNSLTVMVGRFDQNVGLTNTLAEGLSLVAGNLRVITGLAIGIGATFAGIKLASLVGGITSAVRQTVVMQSAVTLLSNRRAAAAAASQAQHAREVAALKAEQAEIQKNIALATRQRAVAAKDVTRATPIDGVGGSQRRLIEATNEERAAVARLSAERQRLGIINTALSGAESRLASATVQSSVAANAAAARQGLLGTAMNRVKGAAGSLVSFLGGPWGIAFGLATTAVYLLVTAQSAAERAADRLAASQSALGQFVDATTGKILAQATALRENAAIESDTRVKQATADYRLAQSNAANRNVLANDPAVRAIQDQYRNRQIRAGSATRQLTALRDKRPELAGQVNEIIGYLAQATTQAQGLVSEQAANRQLRGRGTPQDARIVEAKGNLAAIAPPPRPRSAGPGGRVLTPAQIRAAAAQEAASSPLERARADQKALLAQVDSKTGLLPGKDAVETQHELANAIQAVTAARQAQTSASKAGSSAAAKERTDAAQAKRDAAEAARQARQDAIDAAQTKLDTSQQDLEERAPTITRQAYLEERLKILQTYDDENNAIDDNRKESNRADRQRIADARDVAASRRAINAEGEKQLEIAKLLLMGGDVEAAALERVLQEREKIGDAALDLLPTLIQQGRQEQIINDKLASRNRIVSLIQGTVDDTRDAFEQFVTDLPNGVGKASSGLFKSISSRFAAIGTRSLTEKLFAGTDDKVRELITGKKSVDGALGEYISTLGTSETALEKHASATEEAAKRILGATQSFVPGAAGNVGNTSVGFDPANSGAVVANTIGGGSTALASIVGIASAAAGGAASKAVASNDNSTTVAPDTQAITVVGQKLLKFAPDLVSSRTPSAQATYQTIFKQLGSNIDSSISALFPKRALSPQQLREQDAGGIGTSLTGGLFSKIGETAGKALGGAATGAMVNSVVKPLGKLLGVKTSQTGAQVGGAIGAATGVPGLDIVGSIAGSVIGGLFKKTKKGYANNITLSSDGTAEFTTAGNSASRKDAAGTLAGNLGTSLQNVAQALGATLDTSLNLGSLGQRKDKFTFDATPGNSAGREEFDSSEEAIAAATKYALSRGVITGISQASQNILKSGQNLETAITKAGVIESIPKRLMQLQDPVRYAVTQLNTEFATMIAYLKEGGATAEQFADAQKLYELERAEAIKQGLASTSSAITDFIRDMTGGSDSPYSKRTTYNNASSDLNRFKSDIASGKSVDQNDLLTAARNFQDASRALNGSNSAFFEDFEMLRSLLTKARDNIDGAATNVTSLPASPFADSALQSAIVGLQSASTTATKASADQITSKLQEVITAVKGIPVSTLSEQQRSALGLLPGFAA